jgi:hypothetical protein
MGELIAYSTTDDGLMYVQSAFSQRMDQLDGLLQGWLGSLVGREGTERMSLAQLAERKAAIEHKTAELAAEEFDAIQDEVMERALRGRAS